MDSTILLAAGAPAATIDTLLLAAGGIGGGGTPTGRPSGEAWTLLIAYLMLSLVVSFLCSLLEASFLSVPRSYGRVLSEEGHSTGDMLTRMKESVDRPLAAILTLNTVSHTIGAAGVGAMILEIFGSKWVAAGSVIVTLLILVLSEILPKTLGATHAKRLVPFTVHAIRVIIFATYPIVVCLEVLSRFIGGGGHPAITRAEMASLAHEGRTAGVLAERESRVITNILRLDAVRVSDVMTPRPVAFMLEVEMTAAEAVTEHEPIPFSRIPVFEDTPDQIVGLVLRHDLHKARWEGRGSIPLRDLVTPIEIIPSVATVAQALERFTARGIHLMLAVDEFGGTAGIITLEDAIETLLGVEIVDETDDVADMRVLARTRMERRRAEREKRREVGRRGSANDDPATED